MRAHARLHEAVRPTPQSAPALQETLHGWLPRRETRLMSDEMARTSGLFIPYPLLGILLTLVLALGGGIIGMYVKVDTMNATILMRDSDQRDAIKELKGKLELQELYTKDIREKMIEMRSEVNQQQRRRPN
jgi:hypothetical protein